MPQSHSFILIHCIFSTKNRHPFLTGSILNETHLYLAKLVREQDCECYRVGGVADHVHMAVRVSRTIDASRLMEKVKSQSSGWLKTKSPGLSNFAWQRGYGVFSVSPPSLPELIKYIDNQEEHHRHVTFQDEYRKFLKKYGIEYDEQYVWG